jgi:protein arginine kinase
MENLINVAQQLIQHERFARQRLLNDSRVALEDRIGRSYGILRYAKVIDSKEAMQRLSDVRLGLDLGLLKNGSANLLSELMVMTQAGFLQQIAGRTLSPDERDYRRASLIRDRLRLMESQNNA